MGLALPQEAAGSLKVLPSRPDCRLCDLSSQGARSVGVPTIHMTGSLDPEPSTPAVLVVGMNPGVEEDRRNQPFVGPSGRLLRSVYLKGPNSIAESASVYLGNAVRCWTPLSAQPKASHYLACWSHTMEDLSSVRLLHPDHPVRVLCLGVQAAKSVVRNLLGSKLRSFSHMLRSQGIPSPCSRYIVYFAFHPAAVLRNKNLIFAVADQVSILHDALVGRRPVPSSPVVVPPRHPHSPPEKRNP